MRGARGSAGRGRANQLGTLAIRARGLPLPVRQELVAAAALAASQPSSEAERRQQGKRAASSQRQRPAPERDRGPRQPEQPREPDPPPHGTRLSRVPGQGRHAIEDQVPAGAGFALPLPARAYSCFALPSSATASSSTELASWPGDLDQEKHFIGACFFSNRRGISFTR